MLTTSSNPRHTISHIKLGPFAVTNILSSSLENFATPARGSVCYQNITPPPANAKNLVHTRFFKYGVCGPSRNRTYTIGFGDRCSTTKLWTRGEAVKRDSYLVLTRRTRVHIGASNRYGFPENIFSQIIQTMGSNQRVITS